MQGGFKTLRPNAELRWTHDHGLVTEARYQEIVAAREVEREAAITAARAQDAVVVE